MGNYIVKKVLNNNVLIAENENYREVVLIGKGIGFNRKKGDRLKEGIIEKIFILKDKEKQEQYKSLLPNMDHEISNAIIDALSYIKNKTGTSLSEQVHVALTDHLFFSIYRTMKGMVITHPFLSEIKALYPLEYEIASDVVKIVNDSVKIKLPEGEIGFIALHVHSALHDTHIARVNKRSYLIHDLVKMIEDAFQTNMEKEPSIYIRLLRYLQYMVDQAETEEIENTESKKIIFVLQNEYPFCYNLTQKVIKEIHNRLQKPVGNAEAVYLTLFLQRIYDKLGKTE